MTIRPYAELIYGFGFDQGTELSEEEATFLEESNVHLGYGGYEGVIYAVGVLIESVQVYHGVDKALRLNAFNKESLDKQLAPLLPAIQEIFGAEVEGQEPAIHLVCGEG